MTLLEFEAIYHILHSGVGRGESLTKGCLLLVTSDIRETFIMDAAFLAKSASLQVLPLRCLVFVPSSIFVFVYEYDDIGGIRVWSR